jgi:hypothetical protein
MAKAIPCILEGRALQVDLLRGTLRLAGTIVHCGFCSPGMVMSAIEIAAMGPRAPATPKSATSAKETPLAALAATTSFAPSAPLSPCYTLSHGKHFRGAVSCLCSPGDHQGGAGGAFRHAAMEAALSTHFTPDTLAWMNTEAAA